MLLLTSCWQGTIHAQAYSIHVSTECKSTDQGTINKPVNTFERVVKPVKNSVNKIKNEQITIE